MANWLMPKDGDVLEHRIAEIIDRRWRSALIHGFRDEHCWCSVCNANCEGDLVAAHETRAEVLCTTCFEKGEAQRLDEEA